MQHEDSALQNPIAILIARSIAQVVLLTALLTCRVAPAQAPSDLPPSPFDAAALAGRVPQPDRVLQIPEPEVFLKPVSTNTAELLLLKEIQGLQTNLVALEAAAYAQDPLLKVFGQYAEVAHDWVQKNHNAELGAALRYFGSRSPGDSKPDIKTRDLLVALIRITLYRDLAHNTNFAPLLKGAFEVVISRNPDVLGASYASADAVLGFHSDTPSTMSSSFEAFVAEHDKRYELIQAKLQALQRELAVPVEVINGRRWADMYRLLDGSAQMYVEARTPGPLRKLRQQLRSKYIDLSNLRASLQSRK